MTGPRRLIHSDLAAPAVPKLTRPTVRGSGSIAESRGEGASDRGEHRGHQADRECRAETEAVDRRVTSPRERAGPPVHRRDNAIVRGRTYLIDLAVVP